jgi:4a-hydroxytetrahydrobiopterin dehydratase
LIIDSQYVQQEIPAWILGSEGKTIARSFTFADFKQAFEFMVLSAQYAEELNHHPDWSNSWNKVSVELSTHSAGALTELDIQLAKAMDTFAKQVTNHA